MNEELLFKGSSLEEFLESRTKRAIEAVADEDAETVRDNPAAVMKSVRNEHSVARLTLDFSKLRRSEPFDTEVTVLDFGNRINVPAYGFHFYVPAEGELKLARMKATSVISSQAAPAGRLGHDEVILDIAVTEPEPERVGAALAEARESLERYVGFANEAVARWEPTMAAKITDAVQERKERLEKAAALAAALDIPVKPDDSSRSRW
jgi:hypothetical protein